jgi:hypothetical protein
MSKTQGVGGVDKPGISKPFMPGFRKATTPPTRFHILSDHNASMHFKDKTRKIRKSVRCRTFKIASIYYQLYLFNWIIMIDKPLKNIVLMNFRSNIGEF